MNIQKISRIETGHQLPTVHELSWMLEAYQVEENVRAPYFELLELAHRPGWWREYGLEDSTYVSLEHEAARKYEFRLGYLPGLLQTEQYARASLARRATVISADILDRNVAVRVRRQERLTDGQPLTLHTIVHEPTLHQGVDRNQLVLLAERGRLPNVTLQIVRTVTGLHDGLRSSVTLLEFDDLDEPCVAFADTSLGPVETQARDKTAAVKRLLDSLARLAMSPDDSIKLITALARST